MLIAAIATAVLTGEATGTLTFNMRGAGEHAAAARRPAVDLLVLRRRLPDQDAGLPRARLDGRRLPGLPAAGAGPAQRRAQQGRRLRLPAGRAADLPRRDDPVPGDPPDHRRVLDPLRLGDGLHPDQRAADRRLLLDRPARLHHARDLRPAPRRRRRLRQPDVQPRPRGHPARSSSSPCSTSATRARTCARWAAWRSARRCSRSLFIIVTMATLAIPGSANFVGEFYILTGVFETKVALALIASVGIALAAFYALRLFQRIDAQPAARGRRIARDHPARGRRDRAAGRLHRRDRRSTRRSSSTAARPRWTQSVAAVAIADCAAGGRASPPPRQGEACGHRLRRDLPRALRAR